MGSLTENACSPHSINKYLEVINGFNCAYCTLSDDCVVHKCQLMTPQLTFVFFSSLR